MRMTQDVDLFCSTLGTITAKLVIWPFTLGYYLYKAYVGLVKNYALQFVKLVFMLTSTCEYVFTKQQIFPQYFSNIDSSEKLLI